MENTEIKTENYKERLGAEKGVYRVKFSPGYFLPHIGLLFVAGLGVAIFLGSSGWKVYVSAVIMLLFCAPIIYILWMTLPGICDRLTIFENGFTYKSRKGLQSCLWSEIKDSGEILDFGNRLKTTSVEKRNKEKIAFAYKMRGLDIISHELSDYEFDQIPDDQKATPADIAAQPQTLGSLKATYRVKRKVGDYVPLGAMLFIAVFGIGTFLASKDVLTLFVCALPTVMAFVLVAWQLFWGRHDELKLFENGFSYQTRKELNSCLWHEIADYSISGKGLVSRGDDLVGIKKESGLWISFAEGMQGRDELLPHLRTVIKWTGPEE